MLSLSTRIAVIRVVALMGVVINASYGIALLQQFLAPQYNSAVREILISAIALEFAWAILLLWVAFEPFERRHLLLFT